MTLLIYSTTTSLEEKRLLRIIELMLPEKKFKFYRTIDDFSQRLRQPVLKQRILILLLNSPKELEDVLSIRELLENAKIILIVPDTNPATLARGHILRPRFLSDGKSDFVDVAAVLGRIIGKIGHYEQR
ncbi:MAG: hypothetical protein ABRQ33_04385 [Smithellaceae bacterium]